MTPLRSLALLCLGGSLLLGVLGVWLLAYDHAISRNSEPAFSIHELDRDLGAVTVGVREVEFVITNPADRPRQIIGLSEG
jgi:hypothetical protein